MINERMSGRRNLDGMATREPLPRIGIRAYGVAAIVLGVVGLVWGDFATNWQRVPPDVPFREPLAYLTAIYEVAAGSAIQWRRTARIGALLLTILYAVFVLLWVIQVIRAPLVYDGWGNVFEELSLVIGGAAAFASLAPPDSRWAGRAGAIGRFLGVCAISFGLEHALNFAAVATWVPRWIPPGQMFWSVATAVFFFLAAASLLSGIKSGLAATLLTAQILGFEILVWIPKLIEAPHSHFVWSGNAIGIAIGTAAWVVADALKEPQQSNAGLRASNKRVAAEGERLYEQTWR
jgi:uncharacterized membrane protein YphA (DoxX/SURF4 family)